MYLNMGNNSEMLPVIGTSVVEKLEKGINTEGVDHITRAGVRIVALEYALNRLAGRIHPALEELSVSLDIEREFQTSVVSLFREGLVNSGNYVNAIWTQIKEPDFVEWMFTQSDLTRIAALLALKNARRKQKNKGSLSGVANFSF